MGEAEISCVTMVVPGAEIRAEMERGKNVLINEKGNKRWGGGWGKQLGGDK